MPLSLPLDYPVYCRAGLLLELGGNALEGAILQQPCEEQVASLDQRQVFLVLRLQLRQQARRFQVQQGGGDEQELTGLRQIPPTLLTQHPQVREEFVGHLGQGDLGDVELVLGDQSQEQIERAFEVLQMHREGSLRGAPGQDATGDDVARPGVVIAE